MPPVEHPLPTSSELEILRVIWQRGPSTVREVYRTLAARRDIGYSTVLKFMQIMQEKGFVVRDEREKAHVYRPRQSQRATRNKLVGSLMEKAFRGSALSLVQHVLEAKPATREELDAIRKLIDEAEKRGESR